MSQPPEQNAYSCFSVTRLTTGTGRHRSWPKWACKQRRGMTLQDAGDPVEVVNLRSLENVTAVLLDAGGWPAQVAGVNETGRCPRNLNILSKLKVKSFPHEDSLESSRPDRSARPAHQGASRQSAPLGNHVCAADGLSSERFVSGFLGREVRQSVQHFPEAHADEVGGSVGVCKDSRFEASAAEATLIFQRLTARLNSLRKKSFSDAFL